MESRRARSRRRGCEGQIKRPIKSVADAEPTERDALQADLGKLVAGATDLRGGCSRRRSARSRRSSGRRVFWRLGAEFGVDPRADRRVPCRRESERGFIRKGGGFADLPPVRRSGEPVSRGGSGEAGAEGAVDGRGGADFERAGAAPKCREATIAARPSISRERSAFWRRRGSQPTRNCGRR